MLRRGNSLPSCLRCGLNDGFNMYESEAIDRAIYGRVMDLDDFQTTEHRVQLILALLDQWGASKTGLDKVKQVLEGVLPEVE